MSLNGDHLVSSCLLDDIVSELWRKENVTSGYCPRYRYTLIATLTLANLYYIYVCCILPTHTIGESVLPAHFLWVIRRYFIRRSFHVDRFIRSCVRVHVDHSLDHSLPFVGSFFHGSHSLGSARAGVVRWIISLVVCGRLCPLCLLGIEVGTLLVFTG
jgi:hypothetical protein